MKSAPAICLATLFVVTGCGAKKDSPKAPAHTEAKPAASAAPTPDASSSVAPPPPPTESSSAPAPSSGGQSADLDAINKALIAYGNAGSGLPPYTGLEDLVKQHLLPSVPQPPAGQQFVRDPVTRLYILAPQ